MYRLPKTVALSPELQTGLETHEIASAQSEPGFNGSKTLEELTEYLGCFYKGDSVENVRVPGQV